MDKYHNLVKNALTKSDNNDAFKRMQLELINKLKK